MKTDAGTERNPDKWVSTGWLGLEGDSRACVWLRVGRVRFIAYRVPIKRPFWERDSRGWQLTVLRVAISGSNMV